MKRNMNRSFLCGIFVASTTWCVSLYLYWILVQNSNDTIATSLPKVLSNTQRNALQLVESDEQKQYLYNKFDKEKKYRKISQKLLNELQPVPIKVDTGWF